MCHNRYWDRTQKKPKNLKQYNQNTSSHESVFFQLFHPDKMQHFRRRLCAFLCHDAEARNVRYGLADHQFSIHKQKYWSHAITGALPHPISASHTRAHTQTVHQFPAKRLKRLLLECMLDDETNMQLIIFSCDPWRTSVYETIFFSCKRHEYC